MPHPTAPGKHRRYRENLKINNPEKYEEIRQKLRAKQRERYQKNKKLIGDLQAKGVIMKLREHKNLFDNLEDPTAGQRPPPQPSISSDPEPIPSMSCNMQELYDKKSLEDFLREHENDHTELGILYYEEIFRLLDKDITITDSLIKRLLILCIQHLNNDNRFAFRVLNILSLLLNKIQGRQVKVTTEFVASSATVINTLKSSIHIKRTDLLQQLCFEILLLYPENVLFELVTRHSNEVSVIIRRFCSLRVPEVTNKVYEFTSKILNDLPHENRIKFVEDNLSLWFGILIPGIFRCEGCNDIHIAVLESLTNALIHINYDDCPSWQELFEKIYNPSKFPAIIKHMLDNNINNWDGLWKICIRLLKVQITRSVTSGGSPINSLLPVVESAFKMDVDSRCLAFKCWDVLIDNFYMETNESYIVKRVKLLIIPLKSNNAKFEVVAIAKFDTWWHLISKFQKKLDKFTDTVLISFLHFSFGKPQKQLFVPGLLSARTKKIGAEMFIDLVGHLSCTGCTKIWRLDERMITVPLLVDHWQDWVFSFNFVIQLQNENIGITLQQITCVWKSFVLIICKLPNNNVRKDLFQELLSILGTIISVSELNKNNAETLIHFINSLFDDDKIKPLFNDNSQLDGPMPTILSLLMKPLFDVYYKSSDMKEVIQKLKPIMHIIVNEKEGKMYSDHVVEWILCENTDPNTVIFLWTTLIEALCDIKCYNIPNIDKLLLWHIKSHTFCISVTNIKYSTFVWYKLLDKVYPKLDDNFHGTLSLFLKSETNNTNMIVKLYAIVVTLNNVSAYSTGYQKCVELLPITNRIEDYLPCFKEVCTPFANTLVNIMGNISVLKVKDLKSTIKIIKNFFICVLMTLENDKEKDYYYVKDLENILTHLDLFLQDVKVSQYTSNIIDVLLKLPKIISDQPLMKNCILSLLNTCALNVNDNYDLHKDIQNVIDRIERNIEVIDKSDSFKTNNNSFTAPAIKILKNKSGKKETTIVNTVVDNGEEYIVVKSHWKFNPRKLTENQKEKLQRKREDIPALYQDLSQSQDEFKLKSWKTDSQDSSSTSSKSTTIGVSATNVQDVSNILNNISDVVPKIMENIMGKNIIKGNSISEVAMPNAAKEFFTPKDAKSPRMALKDRVFRNVRSLIEKSTVEKDKNLSDSLVEIETIKKTPPSKIIDNINLVNSASSNICTERPSRVKRKPKKFDDVEIFSIKKGRRCSSQSDSQHLDGENLCESSINGLQEFNHIDVSSGDSQEAPLPKAAPCLEVTNSDEKQKEGDNKIKYETTGSVNHNDTSVKISLPNKQEQVIKVGKCITDVVQSPCISENMIASNSDFEMIENEPVTDLKTNSVIKNEAGRMQIDCDTSLTKNVKTPKSVKKQDLSAQNSSGKKSINKKSRIEKELAIDTVEGHPFLKTNSDKRVTRKNITNPLNNSRRKTLTEKLNKLKSDTNDTLPKTVTPNTRKKEKQKVSSECIVGESQEKHKSCESSDDLPLSEDVIESSQDSSFTSISVKSSKSSVKRVLESEAQESAKAHESAYDTQKLLNDTDSNNPIALEHISFESKDDTEIPQNKTADINKSDINTENMDTEPLCTEIKDTSDVIIIDVDEEPIVVSTNDTCIGSETQEIADADTQPTNDIHFNEIISTENSNDTELKNIGISQKIISNDSHLKMQQDDINLNTEADMTKTVSGSIIDVSKLDEANTASSPLKDEEQRKKDFLNNTFEISPIKSMSPVREKKSPSPETSSDYVVIKLSSPVQSNGEPFEKCDSPEIFTEDKVSPDKRNLSPPREEINVNCNNSPSSSLSLKKNRPQVRSGGRAAQMLGLCVPERLQSIISSERSEPEESKKNSPSSTPARRNLRILYNSVGDTSENNSEEKEDSENFLMFKKSLPTADCSPSVPILKRKLMEITDDATISPATKRKRVSFHDPPVSTTISVQKYIEPCGIRSPQNSVLKRLERQNIRSQQTGLKSQRKLDNAFKLDSVLTKAVESFVDIDLPSTGNADDTQSMSLDETPSVEIVKNSDLNDADPICPDLIDCKDLIDNIASDLSSPSMKLMFLKEIEGIISTVGDLAKMTELEVNRLCIKAPKVKIAKKVLSDYVTKRKTVSELEPKINNNTIEKTVPQVGSNDIIAEPQKNSVISKDMEIQTAPIEMTPVGAQTEQVQTCDVLVQTNDSGCKSTTDIIASCLAEKTDFVEKLVDYLEKSSKVHIAATLPFEDLAQTLVNDITVTDSKKLLSNLLEKQKSADTSDLNGELSFLQDYLVERFDSRSLILFCSQMLGKIHDKQAH